ncbi:MAG TPA: sugar phosphate isomerase/epimerase family protein [Steroidobacteraceae bacterium]|nr:sugar phosphate isomerase/epimerase family protein [Steroidobacteraceae bacterium]
MTEAVRILGSYWTLAVGADPGGEQHCPHDFRLRVETAAKAGFRAMGFWHADLQAVRKRLGWREMRDILDANGIIDLEIEWLLDWFCTGPRRVASDAVRSLLLDAAEALGASHIKIGDLGNDCADVPLLAEEFAVLCRQAGERGTRVLFEMLPAPFSRVPSLEQVLAVCRAAGERNGGIMLDIMHVQRTGTSFEDIVRKIGRDLPLGVEINDGALGMPLDLHDSVVNRRLLPGDGEFDLGGFLHAVWTLGYDGPVGVEVLNEYIRKWPLETAATEAYARTTRVISAARKQWEAARTR